MRRQWDTPWALRQRAALVVVAVLVALVALVAAPEGAAADRPGSSRSVFAGTELEPTPCPVPVPDGTRVECAWFDVPESRARPEGRRLQLLVGVVHARNPAPRADPVLVTNGGPGATSVGLLGLGGSIYARDRDVVVLEQRGTRHSRPALECPEVGAALVDALRTAAPTEEETAPTARAGRRCAERLRADGIDLDAFTTAENAADVADLRTALGLAEWNLWGLSYSTRLMLTVLRDHPDGVRSVVLDSVVPPEAPQYSEQVAGLDAAWSRLAADCAADAACAAAYPDLDGALAAAADRLDDEPLEVRATLPDGAGTVPLQLTGDDLLSAVFDALYEPSTIRYAPLLVDRLAQRDAATAVPVVDAAIPELTEDALGFYYSVQCAEKAPLTADDAARADAGALEGRARTTLLRLGSDRAVCEAWDVTARPEAARPVRSDVPVLVTAGRYDPITPPAWSRSVADGLGSATYLEVPGQGHTPTLQGNCTPRIAAAFLDDPEVAPDTGCLADLGPADVVRPDEVLATGSVYLFGRDVESGPGALTTGFGLALAALGAGTVGTAAALVRARRHPGRRRRPAVGGLLAGLLCLAAVAALGLLVRDTLAADPLMLAFGLPTVAVAPLLVGAVAAVGVVVAATVAARARRTTGQRAVAARWVAVGAVGAAGLLAAGMATALGG